MIILLNCSTFYPSFFADFINAWVCAVVSVVGAFWIYWLSITRIRRDRLKYLATLIESFIESAKRQAKYCSEYSITIKQDPYANHQLKLDANRDIRRLSDKMDQEGVYHAYLWKYKRSEKTYQSFKDIYAYIDFLDYSIDDLIGTNQKVMEYMWQRKKEYKIVFNKFKDTIQRLVLDTRSNIQAPGFVDFASNILQQFLIKQIDGENVVVSYAEVVNPIRERIVKESPSPRLTDIFLIGDELTGLYLGIALQATHNATDYDHYASSLNEKSAQLEEVSKQLLQDFRAK